MSTHAPSEPVAAGPEPTTGMTGLAKFAGVLLIISGLWDVVIGISGILADKIFVSTPQYVYAFDLTGWGWVHLILGLGMIALGLLTTRRGSTEVAVDPTDTMLPGHISLPNGLGLTVNERTGVAPIELTAAEDRDEWAGTPWHKHVPAKLETL